MQLVARYPNIAKFPMKNPQNQTALFTHIIRAACDAAKKYFTCKVFEPTRPSAGSACFSFARVACLVLLPLVDLAAPCHAVIAQENATSAPAKLELYETTFPAMGTLLAFQAYADEEAKVKTVFTSARREVDRLVEILSDYSTESETVLLTSNEKIGQWQQVSPELWEVLNTCDRWHALSDGAFDASIGRLTSLWRKARKSKTIPTASDIESARRLGGWQHVKLDHDQHRVLVDIEGLRFDFGAMGKGYIIDRAYDYLASHGLPCSLVRAGGDLRCGIAPPGKKGWPIEIARLTDAEEPLRIFLKEAAVSSSGDLYQFIEINGLRRSHVLDPRTGIGVLGPRMVTVIAKTSTEADAADTALCVMNDDAALKLAEQLGTFQVRLATAVGLENVQASTDDRSTEKPVRPRVVSTPGFGSQP